MSACPCQLFNDGEEWLTIGLTNISPFVQAPRQAPPCATAMRPWQLKRSMVENGSIPWLLVMAIFAFIYLYHIYLAMFHRSIAQLIGYPWLNEDQSLDLARLRGVSCSISFCLFWSIQLPPVNVDICSMHVWLLVGWPSDCAVHFCCQRCVFIVGIYIHIYGSECMNPEPYAQDHWTCWWTCKIFPTKSGTCDPMCRPQWNVVAHGLETLRRTPAAKVVRATSYPAAFAV